MRCYSMTLSIMPVYTWSINITGFLLLLTLPILTGALIMLLADLHVNTVFFDPIFRGSKVAVTVFLEDGRLVSSWLFP